MNVFKYLCVLVFCLSIQNIGSADSLNSTDQVANKIINSTSQLAPDQRITAISEQLLNKPYVNEPLGEGTNGQYNQEPLYRFDQFDCETYVNTVLALSLAKNLAQFNDYLRHIVYYHGIVTFNNRSHFPSADWVPNNINNHFIQDITSQVAGSDNIAIAKSYVNRKQWYEKSSLDRIKIPGLTPSQQQQKLQRLHAEANNVVNTKAQITYIPLTKLFSADQQPNLAIFNKIPNGSIILFIENNPHVLDLIGTQMNVSHMGFIIWKQDGIYLRAASSLKHKTTDLNLINYLHAYLNGRYMLGIALFQI